MILKLKSLVPFTLALLASVLTLAPAAAEMVLGQGGEVYQLEHSQLAEVFPQSSASVAEDPVLSLEIKRPGQESQLLLVPGTGGAEVEGSNFLVYERQSDSVFVVWESRSNVHSQILLTSYDGEAWSPVIPVSDQRFSIKSSPRLAITRESFTLPAEDGSAEAEASEIDVATLHIVWLEERGAGTVVVYAPTVVINGDYIRSPTRMVVSDLFATEPDAAPPGNHSIAPSLRLSPDSSSVLVGFVNPANGHLNVLRISTLSGELAHVVREMRAHLIDVGARYDSRDPEDLRQLGDDMRAHLIDVGARLDQPLVRFVADEMRAHLIDVGARHNTRVPEDVASLADDMRAHLIDVGFKLDERGLTRPRSETRTATAALTHGDEDSGEDTEAASISYARLESVLDLALPDLPEPSAELHISGSGEHALLSWNEADRVVYRETTSEHLWSEELALELGDDMSHTEAREVLRSHLDPY